MTTHQHSATVRWTGDDDAAFRAGTYSRRHALHFDGGAVVEASASPQRVPVPMSVESAVDPEEAFIAALSSCHMLWFLYFASKQGAVVSSYVDEAVGVLGPGEDGRVAMLEVTLQPVIRATNLEADQLEALHARAHEACFLANSVKTKVRVQPRLETL